MKKELERLFSTDPQLTKMAWKIVTSRKLQTLFEAEVFARGWIETAAKYSCDADYWKKRAKRAERALKRV